ncbi:MAG: hypothetical protein CVU34_00920 [Betaproteobacteria bacterium HGW-Betaproteobacteria-7]|nr:MAG: hypothetical protein CVU34_00920 [Betaproteobacteria bacterium HGW-Betaproteobacteria-7]
MSAKQQANKRLSGRFFVACKFSPIAAVNDFGISVVNNICLKGTGKVLRIIESLGFGLKIQPEFGFGLPVGIVAVSAVRRVAG